MAAAEAKRKRDEIQMIQNVHHVNPFADGGATFALMARDTSSSAEIIHSVIESQRMMYPFDGRDLTRPSLPSSSAMPPIPDWWQLPPLMIEDAPKRARVDVTTPPAGPSPNSQQLVRSKIKQTTLGVSRQAATQRNKSFKKVPGRTPDEALDYLLAKQQKKQGKKEKKKKQKPSKKDGMMQIGDGMLELPPSDGSNPFAVF
jgi:hypothetical protein